MKGYSDIPALHHTVLTRLTDGIADQAPKMMFSAMFSPVRLDSDEAEWETELGSTGMSPFTVPGAPAPVVGIDGYTSGHAKVAYWAEKTFLDEAFLNNLRQIGTLTGATAQTKLGRQLRKLIHRSSRRKEWMCAKAIIDGYFTYTAPGKAGAFTVNYGRPEANRLVLGSERKWGTGASRNPVEDMYDAKIFMSDMYGLTNLRCIVNSATLKLAMMDAKLQDMLKKSAFGNGDLFQNPTSVIGNLLGIGDIMLVDDAFEVEEFVTAVSETTITVEDASQFEVGGRVQYRASRSHADSTFRVVKAVDVVNNTVTVDSAFTNPVNPGRDKLLMRKKFIPDNTVVLMAPTFEGSGPAFYQAPFGIPAHFGQYTDTWAEVDPDGVYLRVQDKGLPIVYNPQTVYTIKVA